MPDRETVIKGLEQCRVGHCDYRCPYASINVGCRNQLSDDAITLLKEQEAIESINVGDKTDIMANLEGLTWDDWRMYHSDTEVQNIAKSAFDLLIALLKEQEAEGNKWIKCSDEMPEEQETIFAKFKGTDKWRPAMFAQSSEDVRVVIVFDDGTRRVSHSHTIDGKWECEKIPLKRTVTHWMPNPKLPKEGR